MTIPPALLKLLQLDIGAQVALTVSGGELVARPVNPNKRRYTIAELLQGSDAMALLNSDTAWAREGEAVGREIG
jgi:antitoxin ChpS